MHSEATPTEQVAVAAREPARPLSRVGIDGGAAMIGRVQGRRAVGGMALGRAMGVHYSAL